MKNYDLSQPPLDAPQFIVCLWFLFLGFSVGCRGQEVPPKPQGSKVDTIIPKTLYKIKEPKARVVPNPEWNGGYAFVDEQGKQVKFFSNEDIYQKNPYLDNNLATGHQNIPGGNSCKFYSVSDLSIAEIKKRLPKVLRSLPPDKVLRNTSEISVRVSDIHCGQEYPEFLVVSYAIELFDKENLQEHWVETTIHVYDKHGEIISQIIDNHNIQGAFISADGKYILAHKIFARVGDGTGEVNIGSILYDVQAKEVIKDFRNIFLSPDYFISVLDKKFSFYGYYIEKLVIDGENIGQLPMKFSIDPENKIIYQKLYDIRDHPAIIPNVKTAFDIKNEDLNTYEMIRF